MDHRSPITCPAPTPASPSRRPPRSSSYGVVVAIAAFLSGALCDTLFIAVGLPSRTMHLLLLLYGMRGFGYPMFAYEFVAIIGDVFWGVMGDRIGWRNTLQWAATPITAIALVYIYVIPLVAGPNFLLIALGTSAVGIGLSAHVPTTPLITAHAHGETGNALAILNLGAGLGAFVGPAVVSALLGKEDTASGYVAAAMALAGLYVISFFLCFALKLPGNARVLDTAPAVSDDETAPAAPIRA